MARPKKKRRITFSPPVSLFLPYGRANWLAPAVDLSLEETEALRLKNVRGLDQTAAARTMHTSQSTFQRILVSAYAKLARGIVYGARIRIK